jgi:TonB family protein
VSPETGLLLIRLRVAEGNSRAKLSACYLRFGSLPAYAFTLKGVFGNVLLMPINSPDEFATLRRSRSTRVLVAWLIIAAVLHAALLAAWPGMAPTTQPFPGILERIDLGADAQSQNSTLTKQIAGRLATPSFATRTPHKLPTPKDHHPAPVATIAEAQDAFGPAAPTGLFTPTLPTADREQAAGTPDTLHALPDPTGLQNEVRARFESAKTYPAIARRYGWEGHLLLGYQVEESGMINNVHVTRSSGNAVLDQSAVRTLNNVGRIPASIWRGGTVLDLQLPVIYKLTQG